MDTSCKVGKVLVIRVMSAIFLLERYNSQQFQSNRRVFS